MSESVSRRVGSTVGLTLAASLIYGLSSGIRANYGILLGPISTTSGVEIGRAHV